MRTVSFREGNNKHFNLWSFTIQKKKCSQQSSIPKRDLKTGGLEILEPCKKHIQTPLFWRVHWFLGIKSSPFHNCSWLILLIFSHRSPSRFISTTVPKPTPLQCIVARLNDASQVDPPWYFEVGTPLDVGSHGRFPSHRIYVCYIYIKYIISGQIIIIHQPRFPWNKGMSH